MIKTKVAFLKGRLLSSQSEQFKNYSKSSDWLEKSQKSHFCFDHVNRLNINKLHSFVRTILLEHEAHFCSNFKSKLKIIQPQQNKVSNFQLK